MHTLDEADVDRNLRALKDEEKSKRRRTEKMGGMILAGVSLLVATIFLWALAVSLKQPLDLMMTLTVVAGGIAMFAWGLKIAIIGRKR